MSFDNPLSIVIALTILVFSAILHEVAHGFVADRLGDPTARLLGRLTLNPIPHIDPFLSILLPLLLMVSGSPILFGGAKPVPIDPMNLRDGRKDIALVSLSGPLTNLVIAIIAAVLFNLTSSYFLSANATLPLQLLIATVQINLLLAIFNLLPIPPLDGSKVFALLLPEREANSYLALGSIGTFILFALLLFPIGGFSLSQFISELLHVSMKLLIAG